MILCSIARRERRRSPGLLRRQSAARLRHLAGTDGPHHNVIKLRPPLVFSESDADFFAKTLDDVLGKMPRNQSAEPGFPRIAIVYDIVIT